MRFVTLEKLQANCTLKNGRQIHCTVLMKFIIYLVQIDVRFYFKYNVL